MQHKKITKSPYHITYLLFIMLFLTMGVFITVAQSQKNQETRSQAATSTNCSVTAAKMQIKPKEQQLFDMINDYRASKGSPKLTWNTALKQSSEWLSTDMFDHKNLSHMDSLGRTPDTRLPNCGFNISNGYGENIAEEIPDPNHVINSWKSDVPHDTIMTDPQYNVGAISMEEDSAGLDSYWTLDVGVLSDNPAPTNAGGTIPPTVAVPTPTGPGSASIPTTSQGPSPTSPATSSVSESPSGTPDPNVPTPTPAKVAVDMQLGVKIKISGIGQGGNATPLHLSRKVTANVYGVGTKPVTSGTGYLTYDGSDYFTGTIHLGKLAEGAYFVTFGSDETLQAIAKPEFQNLKMNQVNNTPPVTLYLGDMDANNILNIVDYNIVLPCFQNAQCADATTIDFNDDGKTDVIDYNLLLQSFQNFHGS